MRPLDLLGLRSGGPRRAAYLCTLWLCCGAWPASGQTAEGESVDVRAIDSLKFRPGAGAGDVLGVYGARSAGLLDVHAGLTFHYADLPVRMRFSDDDATGDLVAHQTVMDVQLSLGLGAGFELGLTLPVVFYQQSDEASVARAQSVPSSGTPGVGDLLITPRYQFFEIAGFALALGVDLSAPTGDTSAFLGDGQFSGAPRLLGELRVGGWQLLANLGAKFRSGKEVENLSLGHELIFGVGGRYAIEVGETTLAPFATIGGGFAFSDPAEQNATEVLGGLDVEVGGGVTLQVGAGGGISRGFGTPRVRALFGLGYTHAQDETPEVPCAPEDLDGFEDEDGCEDLDNDQDGIADEDDRCPLVPESPNGVRDEDGCPEDSSVTQAPDATSRLEMTPPGDRDGDGVEDEDDVCEDVAEDPDGFEDGDGCPEPDNDRDGINDAADGCPLEAEVINGVDDTDGCPDEGIAAVVVKDNKIELLKPVFFKRGSSIVDERSHALLDQVVSVLRAHPEYTRVRIEGHTDDSGKARSNLALSKARAAAVEAYLVAAGIDPTRLESEGFGETDPIGDNETREGREQNRRVEVEVIELNGAPIPLKEEQE